MGLLQLALHGVIFYFKNNAMHNYTLVTSLQCPPNPRR